MAQGDITKEFENDKIEVVQTWIIQVRKATKIMEEQADGSKKELSRSFHRHVIQPFNSNQDLETKKWTHTATDISGEEPDVKAIAIAVWTDTVKANYKTFKESQSS
tara:strand:+ start:1310 stop:1627 length:318 start_codon:yes stop_codon:yes gene_type:complete